MYERSFNCLASEDTINFEISQIVIDTDKLL